jgi:hypothetical protein
MEITTLTTMDVITIATALPVTVAMAMLPLRTIF